MLDRGTRRRWLPWVALACGAVVAGAAVVVVARSSVRAGDERRPAHVTPTATGQPAPGGAPSTAAAPVLGELVTEADPADAGEAAAGAAVPAAPAAAAPPGRFDADRPRRRPAASEVRPAGAALSPSSDIDAGLFDERE